MLSINIANNSLIILLKKHPAYTKLKDAILLRIAVYRIITFAEQALVGIIIRYKDVGLLNGSLQEYGCYRIGGEGNIRSVIKLPQPHSV